MFNEFLMEHQIISLILIIALPLACIYCIIRLIQIEGLTRVQEVAYQGFIIAEKTFLHGENDDKFNYVVDLVKYSLPKPLNLLITDKFLRRVLQEWFDLCKDLLDDGKINNSDNK